MTFNNLVFIKHPNDFFEGLMAKYKFDNSKELSIVAGNNLYCETRYGVRKGGPLLEVSDVISWEVMVGGKVLGWQTEKQIDQISKKICSLFVNNKIPQKSLWSEEDFFLITYADTIKKKKVKNLISLGNFLNKYCKEFSFVHVLPFFPYSSDDGFAVKNFKT